MEATQALARLVEVERNHDVKGGADGVPENIVRLKQRKSTAPSLRGFPH